MKFKTLLKKNSKNEFGHLTLSGLINDDRLVIYNGSFPDLLPNTTTISELKNCTKTYPAFDQLDDYELVDVKIELL